MSIGLRRDSGKPGRRRTGCGLQYSQAGRPRSDCFLGFASVLHFLGNALGRSRSHTRSTASAYIRKIVV